MWIDWPNWQPVSSFVEPVAPVSADVDAAPLVCLQVNASWVPYIVGALMQLIQPTTWDTSDPTVLENMQQQALTLMELVGTAEGCSMLTFQFDSSCVLQFSNDGGATWTDVPGWPTYAPGCYTGPEGPEGREGREGPAGGFTPGTPANPQGVSTAQQACNIAGYLASEAIQPSLSAVVTSINDSETALGALSAVLDVLFAPDVIGNLIIIGVNAIYRDIQGGVIADYESALTDASLWSAVTCAIYNAIAADGLVDSSNFAALVAGVGAISYAHADVISTIVDYLNSLGLAGLQALQLPGALDAVDCSGCATPAGSCVNATGAVTATVNNVDVGSGDWTMMLFVQAASTGANMTLWMMGFNGSAFENMQLQWAASGKITCDIRDASTEIDPITPSAVSAAVWHHVAVRRSGSAFSLWLDGASVDTVTSALGSTWASGSCASILAECNPGLFQYLTGKASDYRLYQSALPDSDIAMIAGEGPGAFPAVGAPVTWLKMDEGTGTVLNDSGSAGVNGTLTAASWTTF